MLYLASGICCTQEQHKSNGDDTSFSAKQSLANFTMVTMTVTKRARASVMARASSFLAEHSAAMVTAAVASAWATTAMQ